jgi:hypothetical protein
MGITELLSGLQLILLGVAVLSAALVIRKFAFGKRYSPRNDPLAGVQSEVRAHEKSTTARMARLEVRLHEFGRHVEARTQSRIALLDRLVTDADRESARLQRGLDEVRAAAHSGQSPSGAQAESADSTKSTDAIRLSQAARAAAPLSDAQQTMVLHLFDAGYSAAQISNLIGRSARLIELLLTARENGARRDAA